MVVLVLLMILMIGSFAAIFFMDRTSRRLADHTAAMAVAEAKVQQIRAATYKPPSPNFGAKTVTLTNSASISLDRAGQKFLVPGTVASTIQPVASGHLITVTATFQTPGRPLSVELQTVVNKFSGGQR